MIIQIGSWSSYPTQTSNEPTYKLKCLI